MDGWMELYFRVSYDLLSWRVDIKTTLLLLTFDLILSQIKELWTNCTERLCHSSVAGFPPRRPGFEPKSGYMGFVMDKVALGQVFCEYFDFPCQFSFRRLLNTHHLSSEAGRIGQLVDDVTSGLSLTPPQVKKCTEKMN
jgi:hypothetical protein